MDNNIKLITDFSDFYDSELNGGDICYRRLESKSKGKGEELEFLSSLGILTETVYLVSMIPSNIERVIVLTNDKAHKGNGKIIMSRAEAQRSYKNYICVPYIEDTNGRSVKVLQIGQRRFRIEMLNIKYEKFASHGVVTAIEEIEPYFNKDIKIPIFSIDYIPFEDKMMAVDFNRVQNLSTLGIDKILSKEEVIFEIKSALTRN